MTPSDRGMGEQLSGLDYPYTVCEVSKEFHWKGKPGLIMGWRPTVEECEQLLVEAQRKHPDQEFGIYVSGNDWVALGVREIILELDEASQPTEAVSS